MDTVLCVQGPRTAAVLSYTECVKTKRNSINRYRKTQARQTLYDIYFFKLGSLYFSLAMHFKHHQSKS